MQTYAEVFIDFLIFGTTCLVKMVENKPTKIFALVYIFLGSLLISFLYDKVWQKFHT